MIVNPQGRVFVGKRIDNKEGDAWQMPQGGIDDGEDLIPPPCANCTRKPA
jgi:putative (di)nucleoside polyphosphate hydrolase